MSLRIWLPLTGNLNNNGLEDTTVTGTNVTVDANGKLGSCYSFNGSSSYLLGTQSSISNDTSDWSFCCWMKVNNAHNGCLFSCRNSINNNGIAIFYYNSQWIIDDGVRWQFTPTVTINSNKWYHVCVVRKKGVGKYLYIDGVLDSSTTTTGTPTNVCTTNFAIGNSQQTPTTVSANWLNGYLNDVRFYDHALSIKEIKELAKGLVVHYPLTGNVGTYNLVKGSNTDSVNTNKLMLSQQYGGSTKTIEHDGGVPCIKIIRNTTEQSGWNVLYYQYLESANIKVDTIYTISFDIIGSGNGNISLYGLRFANGTNELCKSVSIINNTFTATDWSHIVFNVLTKTSFDGLTISDQVVYMVCPLLVDTEAWVMVKNFKVEEGSVDTPWNPNPADSSYSIYNGDNGQIIDISGYNHNCQFYQSTTDIVSDSSRYLTSYRFAGDLTKICYCNTTDFNFTDNFTWAVWIKPEFNSEAGSQYIFTVGRADYGGFGYGLRMISSTRINIKFGSINGAANGWNVDINENEWVHIAFIKSGNELKIYKNGILNTTVTFSGNAPSYSDGSGLGIGCFYYSGGRIYPYYGKISDFRVYATALSADDIKELYNKPISISNHGSLFTQGEFIENNGNNFGKNGLVKFNGAPNPNLMPNSYIMQLGTANPSTGTWRLAGSTSMTKERVLIENGMYGFQNAGVQTPNDGSCYGMDKFPLKANTDYTISMNARIVEGNEGYAGFNIYNATYGNGSHTKIDKNYYVTPLSKE